MKKWIFSFMMITLSFYPAFSSEAVKGAKKDYEQFKKDFSNKLDTAEEKLKELKTKAKAEGSSAKANLALELEETKNKLRKQEDSIKYESQTSWQKMKKGLSEAAEALNEKIQNALK